MYDDNIHHENWNTKLGTACEHLAEALESLTQDERTSGILRAVEQVSKHTANICVWDQECSPAHLINGRNLLQQAIKVLDPSIPRRQVCCDYAGFEYFAQLIERDSWQDQAAVDVANISLVSHHGIDIMKAFSEFSQPLANHPHLGLQGIFHDLVMQVSWYFRFGKFMGDSYTMGKNETSLADFLADGIRVYLPPGDLIYDKSVESKVTCHIRNSRFV